MTFERPDGNSIRQRDHLAGDEGGVWAVATRNTTYVFDLDQMHVTRIPGPTAQPNINDTTRPILKLNHCTVGKPGYWTMKAENDDALFFEDFWQITTPIQSITRTNPTDIAG